MFYNFLRKKGFAPANGRGGGGEELVLPASFLYDPASYSKNVYAFLIKLSATTKQLGCLKNQAMFFTGRA